MYKSSTELFKNELPLESKRALFNIFEDSYAVFKEITSQDLFKGQYISNLNGRLLQYIISKHFDTDMLPKNFYFNVSCQTTAFNQKRVELRTNNMILTIAKVMEKNILPFKARYKEKYAKGNFSLAKQLRFNIDSLGVEEVPYYGIITYKTNENGIEFVDVILPSDNYKYIIDNIELKPHLTIVNELNKETDDERILSRENLKIKVLEDYRKDSEGF